MASITITILEVPLSDRSLSYNISFRDQYGQDIALPAITQTEAYELADKLRTAIEAHTNEMVVVRNHEGNIINQRFATLRR